MKHVSPLIATLLVAGCATFTSGACYPATTVVYTNSHPTDKAWNSAWGMAWKLAGDMNVISEEKALQNCRDHIMYADAVFATPGKYKVHVSDNFRDWDIFINATGGGKGAAGCAKH